MRSVLIFLSLLFSLNVSAQNSICFHRLHSGFAEILIPVNQWHGSSVTVKAVDTNGWQALIPAIFDTSTLPKVTSAGNTAYYYIKQSAAYSGIDLVFSVSSNADPVVARLLPALPQSEWDAASASDLCGVAKADICFNRLHSGFAEILVPVSQWHGSSITVQAFSKAGELALNPVTFDTSTLPKVTSANNTVYYYIKQSADYPGVDLVFSVSSKADAAVAKLLPALPQSEWNNFALQNVCLAKVKGICMNRSNAAYHIYLPKAAWSGDSARLKIYHTNGTLLFNRLYTSIPETTQNGILYYSLSADYPMYANEDLIAEVSNMKRAAVHALLSPVQQVCYEAAPISGSTDWKLAPNSYIFTGKDKNGAAANGLYIPVKKAYAMWSDNSNAELSLNKPIPAGSQVSAYVYWEDVSGLVQSTGNYKLEMTGSGEDAKIKVLIDKAKGKGNAVISLHAGPNGNQTDSVYWSWHVWVTDDVAANGSTYRQGFETDKNSIPFSQVTNRDGTPYVFQWMNRNLGATNAEFLGHNWHKSAGLMYQWGRKDPLPPMKYKDGSGYEINGAAGTFSVKQFVENATSPFGWQMRPNNDNTSHSEVAKNIAYSIKNPLKAITFLSRYGHWFSDQPYKIISDDKYSIVNWDLWSDNRHGYWSMVNTNDTAVARDTKSYELKSPYDPCPCGWRIPSHYSSIAAGGAGSQSNLSSPWGRNVSWQNDDETDSSTFYLNKSTYYLEKVKVYPSIGFDFRNQRDASDYRRNRNLGILPITGGYVFMGPKEPRNKDYFRTTPSLTYINSLTTAQLHTATLSVYDSASRRYMGLVSDYFRLPTENKYHFSIAQIAQSKGAIPVRCMTDPNDKHLGNFETEFIAAESTAGKTNSLDTLKQWTKDANSYIVMTNSVTEQRINLRKAYAMYKLHLSENNQLPQGQPSVSVYWSTNASLINGVSISGTEIGSSEMVVSLNQNQKGNAVVALHMGTNGTAADPVIWSWHVWAPETMPTAVAPYKTEEAYLTAPSSGQIINATNNNVFPPLETTFMDRNMGALIAMPGTGAMEEAAGKKSIGLHYQWGRKDPIPTFLDQVTIAKGGSTVNTTQYQANYVKNFSVYGTGIAASSDKKHVKLAKVLKYSVENPLTYLYNDNTSKDWISNEVDQAPERWGHATEKSPFDPCPEGWRVPDVSFPILNTPFQDALAAIGVKGTSPWYLGKILDPKRSDGLMGINQVWDDSSPIVTNSAGQVYKGAGSTYSTQLPGWGNQLAGWIFNDTSYAIGNYPVTGIRGESSAAVANNFPRVGVWTAAMSEPTSNPNSFALALSIRWAKMQTGIGYAPGAAMSCRCAKIGYDADGNEIARYDPATIAVAKNALMKAEDVFDLHEINAMIKENRIALFPNPVKDIVRIDATDDNAYYYQVYNMAGQLVKEGKFIHKQADLSSLQAGAYLIRINNSESVVKIVKL